LRDVVGKHRTIDETRPLQTVANPENNSQRYVPSSSGAKISSNPSRRCDRPCSKK
jgi:hypothetical protein